MKGLEWWRNDPAVKVCPRAGCSTPVQRSRTGTIADGMALHDKFVHPEAVQPEAVQS